ncbi:DUF421 domain-containing protein [Rummeliibacillus sp. G93]|uniref:DUF421 domain-containing protein n=1 Tax=Rummeliibacillus TaxID=648802 RepID=UPI00117075C6|nr:MULTISPECIES: YetF domain-containing protein [Rummeliibacillus]MBB5169384.1 uncharacterized membrane protein YcaP (DUF421 family) [Rummeliibacillus stabekisii]UQW98866.1 DUF421 domain-containing protein [Rummeliibacillus sp. G93]GEL03645.1 hypothetical protein RST01_02720 [Rummeliibacillus stabekisii]
MALILKTLLLILSGVILLRISGRKSISQMNLSTTILMISTGTILVQPIAGQGVTHTIMAVGILVLLVLFLEYLQLKFNAIEKLITGKSKVVIENGKLNIRNIKKVRLTIDQLEMRLRNQGVSRYQDIKTATIEPNGLLGYELMDEAKPLTVGEFKKIMETYQREISSQTTTDAATQQPTIFDELTEKPKEYDHPDYLQ